MANKSAKKARKGGKQDNKKSVRSADVVGSRSAFFLGCLGAMSAVWFFLPWYANKKVGAVTGWEILTENADLPGKLGAGLESVGGDLLIGSVLVTSILAALIGFGWRQIQDKLGSWSAELNIVLGAAALSQGLVIALVLLHMKVRGGVQFPGHLSYLTLFAIGGTVVLLLQSIDRSQERTEGALPPSDWAILLSSLAVTGLFHYVVLCYKLLVPAPKAIATKLRTFR